jgi:hypothetical protein
MNSKYITGLTIIAVAALAFPAYGLDSYTLPTGKVLKNPSIVGRNPIGIEVAYDGGVIFVKYNELPKAMQKKLNYSEQKEAAYRKNYAAKKKQQNSIRQARAKVEEAQQEQRDLVILERAQIRLGDKIAATKLRIKFLEAEIPKLEAKKDKTMNSSNSLSSRSSNSGGGGYSSYYGNRYSSGNRSDRSERTKRQTVNALNDEYAEAKRDLKMAKTSLQHKKFDLRKMERLYKKHATELVEKRAALGKAPAATPSDSKESKSFMSGITNLFK